MLWLLLLFLVPGLLYVVSQGIAIRMFKFIRVLLRFSVIRDVSERTIHKQKCSETKVMKRKP